MPSRYHSPQLTKINTKNKIKLFENYYAILNHKYMWLNVSVYVCYFTNTYLPYFMQLSFHFYYERRRVVKAHRPYHKSWICTRHKQLRVIIFFLVPGKFHESHYMPTSQAWWVFESEHMQRRMLCILWFYFYVNLFFVGLSNIFDVFLIRNVYTWDVLCCFIFFFWITCDWILQVMEWWHKK